MRVSARPIIAVALLVMAGCQGLPPAGDPEPVRLAGQVSDPVLGTSLREVLVEFLQDGAVVGVAHTGPDGTFEISLPPGEYMFSAAAPCYAVRTGTLEIGEGTNITLTLDPDLAKLAGPPQGLAAAAGITPGTVTVWWEPPRDPGSSDIVRYVLERGAAPGEETPRARLGNSLAYGDVGMAPSESFSYRVRAVNACGNPGPASDSATGAASSVPAAYLEVPAQLLETVSVDTLEFPVFDASGGQIRTATWRVVDGTGGPGNTIEEYVAATDEGTLANFGGLYMEYSHDEGATWLTVPTPYPHAYHSGYEGAVVTGPDGIILGLGFVWAYDGVWANRYSPADDTWYYQPVRTHEPVPDRPWLVAIKGPFTVGDTVVPFAVLLVSNMWQAFGGYNLISYDGLTYSTPTKAELDAVLAQARDISLDLGTDPDRDWMQPHPRSLHTPIGNGIGLKRADGVAGCPFATTTPTLQWQCADLGPEASLDTQGSGLTADALGRLYTFEPRQDSFVLRASKDGGRTWTEIEQAMPDGRTIEHWDYRANAALDQLVVAIHAGPGPGQEYDQDIAFRFTHLEDGPVLKEYLYIGAGDHDFSSTITGEVEGGARFDFQSIALLPSGKIAMSFGDAAHRQYETGTALAIET